MSDFRLDVLLPADFAVRALRSDALSGLTKNPKKLPPKWFYDKLGSELFEEITRLPEYYPTRAEAEILRNRGREIAAVTGAETLVELGSGSSTKTRTLLDALSAEGSLRRYVAFDVSESALGEAGLALAQSYADIEVRGLVADFDEHLDQIPGAGRRLVAFLGGTIGNFEPAGRTRFLRGLSDTLRPGDALLLGTDLVKSSAELIAAYDDAQGVTAAFNKNVLSVLNRELGANFDAEEFEHVATWDSANEWIEMRLRARKPMAVYVAALDLNISFAAGEDLLTEISAKFRRERFASELSDLGLRETAWWTDKEQRFALSLWHV